MVRYNLYSMNTNVRYSTWYHRSVSTLEPQCFENYQVAQEVVPYFETVVSLFQQLNTYEALTSAGVSLWT